MRAVVAGTCVVIALLVLFAGGSPIGAGPFIQPTPSPSPTETEAACRDDWRQIDKDDRRSGNSLEGIGVRSKDLAWAAGNSTTRNGSPIPLIKKWDGRSWDRERIRGSFYVHDVDAKGKGPVWAVGEGPGDGGTTLVPYALKRSQSGRWRKTDVVRVSRSLTSLNDVSVLSRRSVWATGTFWDSGARHRVLIERWTGKRWRHVDFEPLGFAEDVFAHAADDIWVVGATARNGNQVPFTARYNGSRWQVERGPTRDDRPHIFEGVVSNGRRDAWAVGSRSNSGGDHDPLIARWDGERWQLVDEFTNSGDALTAISSYGGELVAVGQNDSFEGVVITYDGTRWSREVLEFPDSDELHDVEHAPNGAVYVVGYRTTVGGSEAVFYRPPLCK